MYASVAVIKSDRTDLKLSRLKNKRICHSEYGLYGGNGWDIPMSYFAFHGNCLGKVRGVISVVLIIIHILGYLNRYYDDEKCDVLNAINRYFGESCLPDWTGTVVGPYIDICAACSAGSCRETKYRGEKGALR